MKRNAFKVKYTESERNEIKGHIDRSEHLLQYLKEFPDFAKRFAIINNHTETILASRSLQVFTSNNRYRNFVFYPFARFEIDTNEVSGMSQLDRGSNLPSSEFNIFCNNHQRNNPPMGFFGKVSYNGFDFETLLLCDISHQYNSFGLDIFEKLSKIVCDKWDEIPDDFEIESYKTSSVSLGMDAEFELIKNKDVVRAGDYFPFEGEIGTDGHSATLEIRPHYANTSNQLLDNLTQLMQDIYKRQFEIETNGDVEALGAHIHFGVQRESTFIKLLDCWIAHPLWQLNGKARGCYKHLSESRDTDIHHGFEYRSLPSGILKDKNLASIVMKVIEGLSNDFYVSGKEISLHPCKEDYLQYIDEDEWKKWRFYKKDLDKRFKADTWGCKRKGELHQRNIPSSLEIDIPIQVYLYKLRKDRGEVFYLFPSVPKIRDYLLDVFKNRFEIEDKIAEVIRSLPPVYYTIGVPYEIHSKPSEYNIWLANFITFLNSSSLEEIPEL